MQTILDIPFEIFLLIFSVGFIGSAINAFAGGGTFLAFPALLAYGLDPLIANATSKLAFIPGNVAAAWAYRKYLTNAKHIILSMLAIALIGGSLGAWATAEIGNEKFKFLIPWLILGATMISWKGHYVNKILQNSAKSVINAITYYVSFVLLGLTSFYGGFFGAGIGVLLIATLSLRDINDINLINAIKNILSVLINLSAVIFYIFWGFVDWHIVMIQTSGAILGGYFGGFIGSKLPHIMVRNLVAITGFILAIIYFYKYGYFFN